MQERNPSRVSSVAGRFPSTTNVNCTKNPTKVRNFEFGQMNRNNTEEHVRQRSWFSRVDNRRRKNWSLRSFVRKFAVLALLVSAWISVAVDPPLRCSSCGSEFNYRCQHDKHNCGLQANAVSGCTCCLFLVSIYQAQNGHGGHES